MRGVVLMYHRIAEVDVDPWSLCVTPTHFAEHLAVVRKHARPLRGADFMQAGEVEDATVLRVAVTFDDGYADNFYHAKPILERYEVPATCFVATGYLGTRSFWWDELEQCLLHPGRLPELLRLETPCYQGEWPLNGDACYGDAERERQRGWRAWDPASTARHRLFASLHAACRPMRESDRRRLLDQLHAHLSEGAAPSPLWRPMTAEEVVALAAGGLVEIGAHTVTHPVLSTCSADVARWEVMESRRVLEQLLEQPVESFAYPYGSPTDYTADTKHVVRETGVRRAFSTSPGVATAKTDCHELPRFHVEDWDGHEFERRFLSWWER